MTLKMAVPKVSVIVPNYNHARFLGRRLESVLGQTYRDFELIYLDDASTDDSAAVFARFAADPRVRAVLNERNGGSPFKQWNKGVREARGEYVWIAEADDFADPRLLEVLVDRLDQNPNVGVAYCQSLTVDEHDAVQFNVAETVAHLDPRRWAADFINDGRDECRRTLIFQCTIPNASAVLFRREVYERAGYADESLRLAGDWMLWARMLLLSDVAFVAEPLNRFRKHSGSVTHRSELEGTDILERCQVVRWIAARVDVPPEGMERVCEGIMFQWVAALPPQSWRLPWARHREIYRAARAVDKRLKARLAKKLTRAALRTLLREMPARARPRRGAPSPTP